MRTVKYFALAVLALGVLSLGTFRAADKDDPKKDKDDPKPKLSIKEVMKKAHAKDASLAEKITGGKGTKEDKLALLDAYTQLAVNKPPKGDLDKWKDLTLQIVKDAQDVVDGKDGAEAKLKKSIDCMGCHKEFRPPPPPKDKDKPTDK